MTVLSELLACMHTAQPQLKWGEVISGAARSRTLPYCEFVSIVGPSMWVKGVGFPARRLRTDIVGEAALDCSWKLVLLGMTDWSECQPGEFAARVKAAVADSLAQRDVLEVGDADFYAVPTFDHTQDDLKDLAWSEHLAFTPGALADKTDGTLGVWAALEYYSEDRIPAPCGGPRQRLGDGGASPAVLRGRCRSPGDSRGHRRLRGSATPHFQGRFGGAARCLASPSGPSPELIQSYAPPGLAREVESITRVAYLCWTYSPAGLRRTAARVIAAIVFTIEGVIRVVELCRWPAALTHTSSISTLSTSYALLTSTYHL